MMLFAAREAADAAPCMYAAMLPYATLPLAADYAMPDIDAAMPYDTACYMPLNMPNVAITQE